MKFAIVLTIVAPIAAFSPAGFAAKSNTALSMSSALIVQNKGGGHGELGFQLAKTLEQNDKITSITILQDDACKDTKEPFKSYSTDIPGVQIIKAPLSDQADTMTAAQLQGYLGEGQTFDYVWDNASKGAGGAGKAVIDCAKEWGCQLLTYVSSAGAYKPTDQTVFPMAETTPVKESAGQILYENYATEQGLPFVTFRPQYIYGKKANKYDYIDWYFDRLVRGAPLPIPGDGTQKVSLTNSEDVATILASVLNDKAAATAQRVFNCGTDQLYTYKEVAELCAEVAGIDNVEEKIVYYDGDALGKAKFPFRLTDFYVAPDMVKEKLGWPGAKTQLKEDLVWYYEGYKTRGGDTKEVDFTEDQPIVSSVVA